jgi:large subunit ribosomal protein L37Ae
VVKIITKEKTFGSVKRFGARYGRTTKHNLSKIEAELRKKHKCPYCHKVAARRLALGIWKCSKCCSKFTGKAYSVSKKISVREKAEEVETGIEEIGRKKKGKKYSDSQIGEEEENTEEKGAEQ